MKTDGIDDVNQIDGTKYDGPWSSKNETFFIDLMDEEVAKGNRPTTTFTRTSWTFMQDELLAKTGYSYTHVQLKNKFNNLRQVYRDFKSLLNDINGKGWDPVLGTITLEEEQWTNLTKVNKKAKKFKKSGCPHYEKMMRIYGDTMTMVNQDHPSTKLLSDSDDENKTESDDRTSSESYGNSRDENHGRSSMSQKSKRRRGVLNDIMSSFVEAYVENSKRKNDILEKRLIGSSSVEFIQTSSKAKDCVDEDMEKCLEILNSMVEIDDKAYTKILKHLVEDTTLRGVFLRIPESRRRGFINHFN